MDERLKNYSHQRFPAVKIVMTPHPYCVSAKHVVYASNNFSGVLDATSIQAYEDHKNSGQCGIVGCYLRYEGHEEVLVLQLPKNKDLSKKISDIEGLAEYLKSIQPQLIEDGFAGVAFVEGK